MESNKASFGARIVLVCITICHLGSDFAYAETKFRGKRKKPKAKVERMTELDKEIATLEEDSWVPEEPTSTKSSGTWLAHDQTLAAPVPAGGQFIVKANVTGTTTEQRMSGYNLGSNFGGSGFGTYADVKTTGMNFGPQIGLMYGLTDMFYVAGGFQYMPGQIETENSGSGFGGTFNSTTTDEGWREPELAAGISAVIGDNARIIGEISGTVPVGSRREDTTNGVDMTTNGLNGGGSITPKAVGIIRLSSLKLVGALSYTFLLDRQSDQVVNGQTMTTTTSGGNSYLVKGGVELPSFYNLGGGVLYNGVEGVTTNSFSVSDRAKTAALQLFGAYAYMGIPISDTGMVLMPNLAYTGVLSYDAKNANNEVYVDRYDGWNFGLNGMMSF